MSQQKSRLIRPGDVFPIVYSILVSLCELTFRDAILHTLLATSDYLRCCCLSIISNQQRWGQVTHVQVSSKSQVPTIKSQASLKSQYKQIKQVKSRQSLTSNKSSQILIRVKSSHTINQEQIYFCHATLLIFPEKLTLIIQF